MAKDTKTTKVVKTECKDYSKILEHVKYCLYVIIALLALNTIILLVVNSDTNTNNSVATEEYDVSTFKSISPKDFMSLVNSKDEQVIYLGRATCDYCVKFIPALKKAEETLDYTTNYVDISNIESASDSYKSMVELINGMTSSYNTANGTDYTSLYGYTPMVVIVKDGKIVDMWIGYGEYTAFEQFLKENGMES